MTVYKFRSLTNMEHILDIIVHLRFYATEYFNLNDPMEGIFRNQENVGPAFIESVRRDMKGTRICSFSQTYENPLLWAHYADGFKGVCLEVELDESMCDIRDVTYDNRLLSLRCGDESFRGIFHDIILSRKYEAWESEKEIRVLTESQYIAHPCVRITSVMFGLRTPDVVRVLMQSIFRLANLDIDLRNTRVDLNSGVIMKSDKWVSTHIPRTT